MGPVTAEYPVPRVDHVWMLPIVPHMTKRTSSNSRRRAPRSEWVPNHLFAARFAWATASALWILIPTLTHAQDFEVTRVATGLSEPVFLTAPPGDDARVFVVEQHTGRIRILRRNSWTLASTPFLTVPGVSPGSEQGLLGLAFHPDYATNGFFYVHLTDPTSRIRRYRVSGNPDVAVTAMYMTWAIWISLRQSYRSAKPPK